MTARSDHVSSGPSAGGRAPGQLTFALRSLLLRRRTAAFALLPLVVAAVALVVLALTSVPTRYGFQTALTGGLLTGLVVPVISLVLGLGAFGDEREQGTLPLLRALPRPRWHTVLARAVAAWLATVVVCLPAAAACAVVGLSVGVGPARSVGVVLAATVLTAAAYCGVFVLLSLLTHRALLAGLAYLVLWETFLAGLAPALRGLSVGAYGRRVAAAAVPDDGGPPGAAAEVVGTLATVGAPTAAAVLVGIAVVGVVVSAVRWHRMDIG